MSPEQQRAMAELIMSAADGTPLGYALRLADSCADVMTAAITCTLVHYDNWRDMEKKQYDILSGLGSYVAEATWDYRGDEAEATKILNRCLITARGLAEDACGVPRTDGTPAGSHC